MYNIALKNTLYTRHILQCSTLVEQNIHLKDGWRNVTFMAHAISISEQVFVIHSTFILKHHYFYQVNMRTKWTLSTSLKHATALIVHDLSVHVVEKKYI